MLCYKIEKNKNKLIIKAVRRKLYNDNGIEGRKIKMRVDIMKQSGNLHK